MIDSPYRIDFMDASGASVRLLDIGDGMEVPLEFGVRQQEAVINPIGARWGDSVACGGSRRSLSWLRVVEHDSRSAALSYEQRHPAMLPALTDGTLRVSVAGGEEWDLREATVLNVLTRSHWDGEFATITCYEIECGRTMPVSGLIWFPGIASEWNLLTHGQSAIHHDGVIPKPWIDGIFETRPRMALDNDGYWFEFGFQSPEMLTGNASAGWTDPNGCYKIEIMLSDNLTTWSLGNFGDCGVTAIHNGDGSYSYWSRCFVPVYWMVVIADFTVNSTRYGKSITGITLKRSAVSLPHYPYAMPADAALLQSDLRASGFPGALVSIVADPISVLARNHIVSGIATLEITLAGTSVTQVKSAGTIISLPRYPYAMPGQQADLQADLRTAGYSGAVVSLYADSWDITLPNVPATGNIRDFSLTTTPGDPFPYWDMHDVYQGLNQDNIVSGSSRNVRTPAGLALREKNERQFARLRHTPLR